MDKSGFSESIDRIRARDDYDPYDAGYKRVIKRIKTEAKIARKTAQALLDAGYKFSVNDGEETVLKRSASISDIMAVMFSTDEDYFSAINAEGKRVGTIYFVYGNDGHDVICDYSTSLESVLAPVNAYAEQLAAREG